MPCASLNNIQEAKGSGRNQYRYALEHPHSGPGSYGRPLGVQDGQKGNPGIAKEEMTLNTQNVMGLVLMLIIVVAGVFLADWLKARIA